MPGKPVFTITQELPASACAEQGFVLLDGPQGMAFAFTPDAAERTAASLIAAAHEARTQHDSHD